MSCESDRTKAYDEDLRWRMVYQVQGLKKSYREVGECLNVDPSTVYRINALFESTGEVSKKKYPKNKGTMKLTDIDKLICLELAIDYPGIYLTEIRQQLIDHTGTDVNESTICRFMNASGFTRQKMVTMAIQRSDLLRCEYLSDMSLYQGHPELFVFVDETGADRRDTLRKFAYSIRGKPATVSKLMVRGQRVSAILGMSCDGILDFTTTTGTTTSQIFQHYVQTALVPYLQPFNGVNARSIVVLDNASIHHVQSVVSAIQSTGALVQFLPPYSPDFNPIELAFAKTKSVLKANENVWQNFDVETAVLAALNTITREDCEGWITHCGY